MPLALGCMRLSTDPARDEGRALATLTAALDAGVTWLDTAAAYGLGEGDEHHNERLIRRVLRPGVGVATKGGMARRGTAWVPDGRARRLREECEASLEALGRIDLYLLHAPDPRTPWRTTLRALAGLRDLVPAVGLCNVSVAQLEEARGELEVAAVQVAVSPFERTELAGIPVQAHSPFGGPRRAGRLARDPLLVELAATLGVSPHAIVLAWLRGRGVMPLPGATRPETALEAALDLPLTEEHRERLDERFAPRRRAAPLRADAEVVLVMGIQGAGKSTWVRGLAERGHDRLNRDERGGTLKGIAAELDRRLATGNRFVLDNTYTTRASRRDVLDVAAVHGVPVRCVWLDTPMAQAQVNVVLRLLARYGHVPGPEELKAHKELLPTSLYTSQRELEPPTLDEGFTAVERVAFERAPRGRRRGLVLTKGTRSEFVADATLVIHFGPEEPGVATCPHGGGPPRCWCRPPLPGLVIPWMLAEDIDPSRSLLVGTGPAHAALAAALGFPYAPDGADPGG